MGRWVLTGSDFIDADVIGWTEGVFQPRRRKGKRAIKRGERRVVAEVLRQDAEWSTCSSRNCELVSVNTGWLEREVPLLGNGTETKPKRRSIVKGKPERLFNESVRSVLASRFLGRRADDDDEDEESEECRHPTLTKRRTISRAFPGI
jgi:hypothetical protein